MSSSAPPPPSAPSSSVSASVPSTLPLRARGGVYVPPHKARALAAASASSSPTDSSSPSSPAFQQQRWDELRRSLHGLVNRLTASNLTELLPLFFNHNLIRGRGLLVKSLMKAQLLSTAYTPAYAALTAILNTKLPELGALLVTRLLVIFRRAYTRNDKHTMSSTLLFLAHLFNQRVLHVLTVLQLLTLLLESVTDDSVEVACEVVTVCGPALTQESREGIEGVMERLRQLLHEGAVSPRVGLAIERLMDARRGEWNGRGRVVEELDLVEEEDAIVHEVSLDEEELDMDNALNVWKFDEQWQQNEDEYEAIRKEILGDEVAADEQQPPISDDQPPASPPPLQPIDDSQLASASIDQSSAAEGQQPYELTDLTETDLINLRRTIYLTIMSSLSYEETAHKLLKMQPTPQQQPEIVNMILECCSMEKTYLTFYGSLAERFCHIDNRKSAHRGKQSNQPPSHTDRKPPTRPSHPSYKELMEECFVRHYAMIHRFETNRIRNLARLFAHLYATDAIDWSTLSFLKLTEEDTTSAGRIFIKILLQEVVKVVGLVEVRRRFAVCWRSTKEDEREVVAGLMPRSTAKELRFAINFFTSIGLGGLTEDMRDELKVVSERTVAQQELERQQLALAMKAEYSDSGSSASDSSSGSDSSDGSSDDSDSYSDSSDSHSSDSYSSDSDSEEEERRRRRRKQQQQRKDGRDGERVKAEARSRDRSPPDKRRDNSSERRSSRRSKREYSRERDGNRPVRRDSRMDGGREKSHSPDTRGRRADTGSKKASEMSNSHPEDSREEKQEAHSKEQKERGPDEQAQEVAVVKREQVSGQARGRDRDRERDARRRGSYSRSVERDSSRRIERADDRPRSTVDEFGRDIVRDRRSPARSPSPSYRRRSHRDDDDGRGGRGSDDRRRSRSVSNSRERDGKRRRR